LQRPLILRRLPGPGWIVLIGGGEFSFGETREIDEFMVSRVPEANRRAAFIPAASGSSEYGSHFAQYLKTISPGLEVTNVPIYRQRDARRGRNIAAVREAGLIYVGAGVASLVVDALQNSPALEAMRDALADGAVVAGIGAGATAVAAIGFLPGAAIQAPFEPERDLVLRSQMSDPQIEIGIGIPARTAVAVDAEGKTEIVGEGSLTVMRRATLTPG
jgi:cyanophycinase